MPTQAEARICAIPPTTRSHPRPVLTWSGYFPSSDTCTSHVLHFTEITLWLGDTPTKLHGSQPMTPWSGWPVGSVPAVWSAHGGTVCPSPCTQPYLSKGTAWVTNQTATLLRGNSLGNGKARYLLQQRQWHLRLVSAAKGKASACLWEEVSQILYLLEISYSWASTAQGIPATVTVSAMSWCFCPRFEPVMVILVPPSTGPDRGYTCKDIRACVNVTVSQTSAVWQLIYSTGPFSCTITNSCVAGSLLCIPVSGLD